MPLWSLDGKGNALTHLAGSFRARGFAPAHALKGFQQPLQADSQQPLAERGIAASAQEFLIGHKITHKTTYGQS